MTTRERGTTIGVYELIEMLGAGGMGEVWKARDRRLDRFVAVKFTHARFADRFEREARTIATLNHPYISQLYDVGPDYLVMELIEGEPLKGPLSIPKATEYAGQILDALDAAHRSGIVHRDLKPANILVTTQGIKLLDFGLARHNGVELPSDTTQTLTQAGQIVGTLQYMSPEQLQGQPVDTRTDLFSFGCVLYEMITGITAFTGQSAASVIAAVLEREPAPLHVPFALDRVVRRSLAKNPDERFQTARDLKAALLWAVQEPAFPMTARSRKWRWIAWTALGGLAIGVGSMLTVFQGSDRDREILRLELDPPPGAQFVPGLLSGGLALSPDGKSAAFVSSVKGRNTLWVRSLNDSVSRELPETDGAQCPFWSPDSESIAFYARGKLRRIDRRQGNPEVICDVSMLLQGGSWANDSIIFVDGQGRMLRVAASGGNASPVRLQKPEPSSICRWPRVLPGDRVLYWASSSNSANTGVFAESLSRPERPVRLVASDSNAIYARGRDGTGYLLWVRAGVLFAQEFDPRSLTLAGQPQRIADHVKVATAEHMTVSASDNGLLLFGDPNVPTNLQWLDRTGSRLSTVGQPSENTFISRLSADGRRIVVQRGLPQFGDLWVLDTERGLESRLTSSGGNSYPIWSADSRNIVFTKLGANRLYRKPASGLGEEKLLVERASTPFAADWSFDGKWILATESAQSTRFDLWLFAVTADGKLRPDEQPRPYLQTPFSEAYGRFSPEPNSRWLAFQSDESGIDEVYIDTFPEPRGKRRVSTRGGRWPAWAQSGRELLYASPDSKVMSVRVAPAGDSVELSAPRELFTLPVERATAIDPFHVTADGRRFLVMSAFGHAPRSLSLVINWPTLLTE